MTEKEHPHIALLSSYAKEFRSQLRRINSFTKHSGSVGTSHEGILRRFLQTYVPQKFAVSEGFIADKQGQPSSQCDIIIWSHLEFSPYYRDRDFVIVPAEAVKAVVEVKTTLDRKTLHEAFEQLEAVSRIRDDIYTAIFAFESINLRTLLRNLVFDLEWNPPHMADSIYTMQDWVLQRLTLIPPNVEGFPPDGQVVLSKQLTRSTGMPTAYALHVVLQGTKRYGFVCFLGFLFKELGFEWDAVELANPAVYVTDSSKMFLRWQFTPGEGSLESAPEGIEQGINCRIDEVENARKILQDLLKNPKDISS